ncbi:MAG: hypothetical protein R3C68_14405 [Myxococcota bacterium]
MNIVPISPARLTLNCFKGLLLGTVILTTGCGVETLVQGLQEKEANEIYVLLADYDVKASKSMFDTGREITFSISVPREDSLKALRILTENEFPRPKPRGHHEVYGESGLIPTSSEEKAKRLAAIEGEIEKQLLAIDGVLNAQVNISMPDDNELRTTEEVISPPKASVAFTYLPGANDVKPISEHDVKTLVAGSVEKLVPENVYVVPRPGRRRMAPLQQSLAEGGVGPLSKIPLKVQRMLIPGIIILILLLSLAVAFGQMRLKTVRGRLIRLQNEIAKARRKAGGGDSLPAHQ